MTPRSARRMSGRRGSGLRWRKRWHVAPGVYANASRRGLSWTLKVGPWSWNSRRRAYRMDLPGPLWWQGRPDRGPAAILACLVVPVAVAVLVAVIWMVAR